MSRVRVGDGAALVQVAADNGEAAEVGAAAEGAGPDGAEEDVGADEEVAVEVAAGAVVAWLGAQLKRFSMMLLIVSWRL